MLTVNVTQRRLSDDHAIQSTRLRCIHVGQSIE
jgi:hypothetical protein